MEDTYNDKYKKDFKLCNVVKCTCGIEGCEMQIYKSKTSGDKIVMFPACSTIVQYPILFDLKDFITSKNIIVNSIVGFIDEIISTAILPLKFLYNLVYYKKHDFLLTCNIDFTEKDIDTVANVFPEYKIIKQNDQFYIDNYYNIRKDLLSKKTKFAFFMDGYVVCRMCIYIYENENIEREYNIEELLSR